MSEFQFPIDDQSWRMRCASDGQFKVAAKHLSGSFVLRCGEESITLHIEDGEPAEQTTGEERILISAEAPIWMGFLAETPPRLLLDPLMLVHGGAMSVEGNDLFVAQAYPALMRAIELLGNRTSVSAPASYEARTGTRHDTPVGRYVHFEVDGQDYRVYYETAGSGIPLLLQHTAGCHGGQWRHLMECEAITSRFQLFAYDLPFHGKSVPPVGKSWWTEEYQLRDSFLREFVVAFKNALEIENPVFMGCSVGGMLALDLARHCAEHFSAVISLEGGLKVEDGGDESLKYLYHPKVSNEFKARLMNGIMAPMSPVEYRQETMQVYAAGWPPVFLGDLFYYRKDYDLREEAANIDTSQVDVYILSGEYDASGTLEMGMEANAAIAGSKWYRMDNMGHFPMSENPELFIDYITPVLDEISSSR